MLCALLLPMVAIAGDFASFFVRQVDAGKKRTVALVCVDSLSLGRDRQCEVNFYTLGQRSVEKRIYGNQSGEWGQRQRLSNARLTPVEVEFYSFLNRFSLERDFQVGRTIFPLPITYKYPDGTSQKKLVMPRDWEEQKITQRCPTFYSVQPQRTGNNRKIYIFHQGALAEYYNFIYISKQWYLIEMEIYL